MLNIRRFKVIGDKLIPLKYDSFNSGSKGYYKAVFSFGKDWEGLIPHITISENGKKRADEVIVDNTHKITVTESGTMRVGVYGLDAEGKKCISSNEVLFEVLKGAYDGAPALPSDIWEGYQITVLGYVERAEAAAGSVKNFTVSAVPGSEAKVEKIETDTGIHYEFTLPQGDKGKKGDAGKDGKDGDDGKTPVKGVDYWTDEDKTEIIEEIETPKSIIEFANGARLESREDGIYFVHTIVNGAGEEEEESSQVFDNVNSTVVADEADYALQADYAGQAYFADMDNDGNDIIKTYATKKEVESPKQVVEFTNGIRLVAGSDGMYFAIDNPYDSTIEEASRVFFCTNDVSIYANESDYAYLAQCDGYGNDIQETYATKEEVNTKIQTYIDEAILGGAW